jgi:phi LC3 family holin
MYYKEEGGTKDMLLGIDLKARLKNKAFWVAIASAIALLSQQLGLNIIPDNYTEIVNTVLAILTMLGIVVDTSTPGISDKISSNATDTLQTEISKENKTIE